MRWIRKKRPAPPRAPRKNHWRGMSAKQVSSERVEAGRVAARRKAFMQWSGRILGAGLLGWVCVSGAQQAGPAIQQLLEIRVVKVEGLHRIVEREIIDLVRLKPGSLLHQIAPEAIRNRVESHPWVKQATVSRFPFHELRISVVERKPAAVVQSGVENFLSDDSGHMLARLGQADDVSLPMVTGVDSGGLLRGDEQVRQVIMSGIELAKLVGHTYEGRLQVNAENPSNLVASVRGVQFQFGHEAVNEQWDRFRRVRPTLRTLNFDGHGNGANEVDLRYENRVIVRERG